ncbi:hypothetical protein [Delftia lacustris]|uniref:hypothetical protein n=1 Tax=Delftia lacustris TaxID=558537 RepID=UPI0006405F51|nr:hypothetical protein [Delftia lacustris]
MTDYTPTTAEVRNAWWRDKCPENDLDFDDVYNAAFDRWLAAHDAEVRAGVVAEAGPWESGCFGHCDPEGWHSPCRVPVKQEGADDA